MSRLNPKLQLQLLAELPSGLDGQKLVKQKRPSYATLFRAAGLLAAFSGLAMQTPSAWALDFDWGTATNDWTTGQQNETYQVGGVTLDFAQVDPSGVQTGSRPRLGNTFVVAGNANTPITGGLGRGNVLLGIDSPTLGESLQFVLDATNAAGDRVPLDNVRYTIIDIDRSCNRGDSAGTNLGEILWQDVVSTRALLGGAAGTPVTPTISGALGETVDDITAIAGTAAGYTPDPGSLTFRGITDPTPETLTDAQGNAGCNALPSGTVDNDDNRGVEASNNNAQPPGVAEGNVSFAISNSFTDRIEFEFGNGVAAGANNGLSEPLTADPSGHGIGVFGDLSFNPAIVGISETSTAPVLQTTGPEAGQYLVTYTLRVTNPGETALDNIEVENDLVTTFVSAPGFSVVPGSITGALPGETFNGGDTTDISGAAIAADNLISLAGGQLAAGGSRDITFDVLIDSSVAGFGPFSNQSIVRANPVNSTSGVADINLVVRDRSSNANTVGNLNPDADEDDPDDGVANGASFTNPFNAAPGAINRDTAGDTDPSNNDSPTVVVINPAPAIGVTKQVSNVTDNNDGTYTVTYRQIVRNLGNEVLNGVTLDDQAFATTFRTGTATGVTSATIVASSLSVPGAAPAGFPAGYTALTGTPTFDGVGNLQLATVASLPVGGYGIVDYQVLVDPTDSVDGITENLGDGTLGGVSPDDDNPYESQVTATGTGATSTTVVTDLSDDVTGVTVADNQLPRDLSTPGNGTATDPESSPGVPQSNPIPADDPSAATNENNRTPVTFAGSPAIALSKRVTNVTANRDGTFDVTYRQLVQNIGAVALDNVQIAEDSSIANVFRVGQANGATSAVVQSVTAVAPGTVSPGDPNGVAITAGTPAGLSGAGRTLLSGTDTLQPNQFGAVDYVVRVTPGNNTEGYGGNNLPFSSQATATGTATTVGGTVVTDPSDDGVEFPNGAPGITDTARTLDPDNNNNANEGVATLEPIDPDGNTTTTATQASENNPTPVRFPKLAISKNISGVTGSGTAADPYIVTYDVTVQNVGGIRLSDIQVTEQSIDDVFNDLTPSGNATLVAPPVQTGGITTTPNTAFDGETVLGLIDPGALLTLEPDESSSLQYQVQLEGPIELPTRPDPYTSSSTASGTGIPADGNGPVAGNPLTVVGDSNADGVADPGSSGVMPVSDLSDDGTDPDPTTTDGNRGSGPGENDPTAITFPVGPQIGLTKQVVSTVPNADGSFDVTFEYRVQNVGIVPLDGLDITDNYDTQFDVGQATAVTNYEVISITPGTAANPGDPTLVANGAAVGSAPNSGDLSLATGNTTVFDPGEAATVQVVVRVTPEPDLLATVYDSTAVATGTSTVDPTQTDTDLSDDIPPVGATDPRVVTADPGILGEGTAGQSAADATPVVFDLAVSALQLFKTITFTSRTGAITTQLTGAPTGVLGTNQVPEELQSGDLVEYSIYYFNNAGTVFPDLEICDALPSPLTPVLPIVGGSFINELTPLPLDDTTGRSCPDGTSGTQGAVIFPVGDVAPASNGSVVFRTLIP